MYIHTTIATNLIHKDDIGIIFAQNINMAYKFLWILLIKNLKTDFDIKKQNYFFYSSKAS